MATSVIVMPNLIIVESWAQNTEVSTSWSEIVEEINNEESQ